MLKKIFKKKKHSEEHAQCKSVDAANPTYVLHQTENNDQINMAYYNDGSNLAYMNINNQRPCYANIDEICDNKTTDVVEDQTYQGIWGCNSDQDRKLMKANLSEHMYEACTAAQIQDQQLKDVALQKWYFGYLDRDEAESRLANTAPSTFLVRQSSRDGAFILSLKSLAGPVAHIRIGQEDGYSLQGSTKAFYTVGQMITHFTSNEIVIQQLGLHQLLCHGLINPS